VSIVGLITVTDYRKFIVRWTYDNVHTIHCTVWYVAGEH